MCQDGISVGQVLLTATFVLELRSNIEKSMYVAVERVCALEANCERHGSASCSTCLSAVLQFHLFPCSNVTVPSLQFCFLCHQVSRCTSFSSLPFLITSKDTSTSSPHSISTSTALQKPAFKGVLGLNGGEKECALKCLYVCFLYLIYITIQMFGISKFFVVVFFLFCVK